SAPEVSEFLELKGVWNYSLITKDLLICGGVLIGGMYMAYSCFTQAVGEVVHHQ
nr:6K2 [Donkey orchid virus A]